MLDREDLEKLPDEDNPQPPDGDEVSTGFTTKGLGWSGRDEPEDSDDPPV